jgi:hypothetical protein
MLVEDIEIAQQYGQRQKDKSTTAKSGECAGTKKRISSFTSYAVLSEKQFRTVGAQNQK